MRTEETINALKNGLLTQNWGKFYQITDISRAYDEFLRIFTSLYNKNCPIIQHSRKIKYAGCLWITKGLQNAHKEKNTLHRDFLRLKTKEAENNIKNIKIN